MVYIYRGFIDLPRIGRTAVLVESSKRELDYDLYYDCKNIVTGEIYTVVGSNIESAFLFDCKQVVLAD
jgi:hypothetical protein